MPGMNDFTTINNPIPAEWESYISMSDVGLEIIPDQLYDTLTFTDAVTTNLEFFAGTPRANQSLSNMRASGQLPNPQTFLIEALTIRYVTTVQTVDQGAAGTLASKMNDILLLQNSGRCTLQIGEKNWGPWLPWTMPNATGLGASIGAAGGEAANLVTQYGEPAGPMWVVEPKIMIPPLVNFQFNYQWPTAPNLTEDMVVQVLFYGKRARGIQ